MTHSTPTNTCTTRVVHVFQEPFSVYIGRGNQRYRLPNSKWGNPFKIGRDGTRDQVIEKYHQYIASRPDLIAALPELQGKVLGCWCKPAACHGDVLVQLLEQMDAGSRN